MARHWPKENLLHSPANLRQSISECDYCYLFALDKRDDGRRMISLICSANCNPSGFPFGFVFERNAQTNEFMGSK